MSSTSASTSHLTLDITRFDPENISEESKQINTFLENGAAASAGRRWYQLGPAIYRQMIEDGTAALPKPEYLPKAKDASLSSRDAGRGIPIRVYKPDNGQPSKGIFLHIHGGGFVLATHKHSDRTLKLYANECQLTAISIGYRLAPEHPYPAAMNDCIDVAEQLVDNVDIQSQYGGKLLFMAGESAGACLTVQTAFHLLRSRPEHTLAGLILPFGYFDLTLNLPSMTNTTRQLIIDPYEMSQFNEAYVPGMSIEQRRNPAVSPLYEDLRGLAMMSATGKLPPALILVGTEDCLLDDSLLMGVKWLGSGSEAFVKVYPGAPHGFTLFPSANATDARAVVLDFMRGKL